MASDVLTLDEFLALPEPDPWWEFADGRAVVGGGHDFTSGVVLGSLLFELEKRIPDSVAEVLAPCSFTDRGRNWVVVPDASVVVRGRVPRDPGVLRVGPLEFMPDIAIEVLSPHDDPGHEEAKRRFYADSAPALTWFVDPRARTVEVWANGRPLEVLSEAAELTAPGVCEDLRMSIGEIFKKLDR